MPAPFGPISAWISPASMTRLAFATARMPPNCFETPSTSSTCACPPSRAQECRQRQALVDLALAHRGGFFRRRAPAAHQLGPDADEAAGRIEHEADEHEAEPEQPVRGPDREQLAEQDVEQHAERRPEDVVHAADHHHRQQLAGERHRDGFGRDEIGLEAEQRAGEPGHHRRDHERHELVALDRIALERRAQLVLADRHQHVPERRARHAQQHDTARRARSARPGCSRHAPSSRLTGPMLPRFRPPRPSSPPVTSVQRNAIV